MVTTRPSRVPDVSVMMPAYNAAPYIAQAVESVIAQTHRSWELLVVDDGSTDGTGAIAQRFDDPRITVVRRDNGGEGAARNTALSLVRGRYLAFLDADDAWLPGHLEESIRYLDAHPADVGVYTDGHHITEDGRRLKPLSARRRGPLAGRLFDEVVRGPDVFGPPVCVVLRVEPIQAHGLRFDESLVIGTDWDFLIRVAALGGFGYLPQLTCLYRVHRSNVTSRVGLQRRARALAACRMHAVIHPSFADCPEEVRVHVLYDLLAVLLRDDPATQDAIVGWPQFEALSRPAQARLLRLMASKAIINDGSAVWIRECLRRSRRAHGTDVRGLLLAALYGCAPGLCRAVLRWWTRHEGDPRNAQPFADLEADPPEWNALAGRRGVPVTN